GSAQYLANNQWPAGATGRCRRDVDAAVVPKLFTVMSTAPPKVASVAKSIDSPQFRSQRGRLGACAWGARTEDWTAQTLVGRRALLDKFDGAAEPMGRLTIQERAKRAEDPPGTAPSAPRKAHIQRMVLKAVQVGRGWRQP